MAPAMLYLVTSGIALLDPDWRLALAVLVSAPLPVDGVAIRRFTQHSLRALTRGHTTFVIAHRLSTRLTPERRALPREDPRRSSAAIRGGCRCSCPVSWPGRSVSRATRDGFLSPCDSSRFERVASPCIPFARAPSCMDRACAWNSSPPRPVLPADAPEPARFTRAHQRTRSARRTRRLASSKLFLS